MVVGTAADSEGVAMPGWLIIALVFMAFFVWAGFRLRGRGDSGPNVRDERTRTTRGGDSVGSG